VKGRRRGGPPTTGELYPLVAIGKQQPSRTWNASWSERAAQEEIANASNIDACEGPQIYLPDRSLSAPSKRRSPPVCGQLRLASMPRSGARLTPAHPVGLPPLSKEPKDFGIGENRFEALRKHQCFDAFCDSLREPPSQLQLAFRCEMVAVSRCDQRIEPPSCWRPLFFGLHRSGALRGLDFFKIVVPFAVGPLGLLA